MLGDLPFDLASRCIAHDMAYDVATFRVTPEEVHILGRSGKHVLTGSQRSWPPPPPSIGRGVFFVGFPGDGRRMRPYRSQSLVEIDWLGYTTVAVADCVSGTDITLFSSTMPTLISIHARNNQHSMQWEGAAERRCSRS
jgi:hypothetical protein